MLLYEWQAAPLAKASFVLLAFCDPESKEVDQPICRLYEFDWLLYFLPGFGGRLSPI
jgi:hypothetical protein